MTTTDMPQPAAHPEGEGITQVLQASLDLTRCGDGLRGLKAKRLLRLRDKLAATAVEHLCHDLPGADLLWASLGRLEDQIQRQHPQVWAEKYPEWVQADAAALHSPDRPAQDCRICRYRHGTWHTTQPDATPLPAPRNPTRDTPAARPLAG